MLEINLLTDWWIFHISSFVFGWGFTFYVRYKRRMLDPDGHRFYANFYNRKKIFFEYGADGVGLTGSTPLKGTKNA